MKRVFVTGLAVFAIALMACEGDNPSEPGGTLPTVTGLAIDAASAGNEIVLTWEAVTSEEIEGYEVYFSETSGGSWTAAATTSNTTYTHVATCAGYYSVRAYDGDNYSESYATSVNTMPNEITETYSIYDQFAPGSYYSGFIFGATGGTTGLAGDPGFEQDMYAYDYSESRGDSDTGLSSGSVGAFPNGNETWFYAAGGVYGYCPAYGATGWWSNGELYSSDDVIFAILYDDYYVKIYIDDIIPEETSANGTELQFHYEFQPINGVSVFTSNSS